MSAKFSNACGISNALNIESGFVTLGEVEKYQGPELK